MTLNPLLRTSVVVVVVRSWFVTTLLTVTVMFAGTKTTLMVVGAV